MNGKEISPLEVLIETHVGLDRQGPGSPEATLKALSFLEDPGKIRQAADMGCGAGGQTLRLAQQLPGAALTGVDQMPDFIRALNSRAREWGLEDRVKGVVGAMEAPPFAAESRDLIWSEGAIDSIGFERGLQVWHGLLKKGGAIVVSAPTWFTNERPAEVERFWTDAGSGLQPMDDALRCMLKTGYRVDAAFALPESGWTDHYFLPREAADKALLQQYPGNRVVAESVESNRVEAALFERYGAYYGYAFYIGRKR